MTEVQLRKVCSYLEQFKIKEHFFFMTRDEFVKEFDWLFFHKNELSFTISKNENNSLEVCSILFKGITFYIVDINL